MRNAKRSIFSCLLLIFVLSLVACGGDKSGDNESPTEVAPSSSDQAPTSNADTSPPVSSDPTAPSPVPDAEPDQVNSVVRAVDGMTMLLIPAGEFLMGDDASAFAPERPAHLVTLDDYWIDQNEVTNAQYRLCVDAGACSEPEFWWNADLNGDQQPVLVPWEAAQAYCTWVGGRLPTEAEWEKAARGTDGRLWPWGNQFEANRANLSGDADGYGPTAPVSSFPGDASPYGLLDVAGNAAEWVSDWFDREYYANSPTHNPTGPATGDQKVHRGTIANAGGGPEKCRTVARYGTDPSWDFGFRCAATTLPELAQTSGDAGTSNPETDTGTDTGMVSDMEGLNSYRTRIKMRSPNLDGSGWGPEELIEMAWVREPESNHTVMHDASGGVQAEIITIGTDTWMNMGGQWMHSPAGQDAPAATPQVDVNSILSDLQGGMTLLGEETVNGVHCKHYSVDTDLTIEMPNFQGEGTTEVTAHIKGEMWLADESGLPTVAIRSQTETSMQLFGDQPLTMYEEREMYDINTTMTIEPPAGATELPSAPAPSTDQPESPVTGQTAGPPQVASLEDLNSYRLTMNFQAGEASGEGAGITITEAWTREPPARHMTWSMGAGLPAIEYILIGDAAWMKTGDTWIIIPQSEVQNYNDNLAPMLTPDPNMTLVGEEIVNGIPCKHYVMDFELPSQSLHHEMWVANRPDLPSVAIKVEYRTEITANEMTMVTEGELNVTDLNTDITIEPPQL